MLVDYFKLKMSLQFEAAPFRLALDSLLDWLTDCNLYSELFCDKLLTESGSKLCNDGQ